MREKHIEVLYGNNTIDMVYVALYRLFFNRNIKTVLHIHDILQREMFLKFIKKNDHYINAYIVPSEACKDSFLNCVAQEAKIYVVYNGINLSDPCVKRDLTIMLRRKYFITPKKKFFALVGVFVTRTEKGQIYLWIL